MQPGDVLHGFSVHSTEELPEIDGQAIVMDHAKSGAQLLYLKNDDENKSFSITFKTPPADDTGVFHILEHSVLCGSEKYPVKEPFVNLLRTSMQTFLNALTFPDKTMYPVASTNEQDLYNLVDVYLDAVLHPMLHVDHHIFEQEGWHYEVERPEEAAGEERLVYNGVVFNEMKGSLSNPDNVLFRAILAALFPGTCYAFESGGDPASIPQLTYEGYCNTHARHYRLDNSYIVLYGDLDIERMLAYLDENYLGVAQQPAPGAPNPVGDFAPVKSVDNVVTMNTSPDNAMVGLAYVVGEAHDFERILATDILADALMGGNESPIKRAILDSGLGGDTSGMLVDALPYPALMFDLKNAQPGVADKFRALIEDEARKLVDQGIPRDLLEASIAQMAFALRERDRGMADGVVLAMNAMGGWLYDDADATRHLHFDAPLTTIRAGLDNGYFEKLLEELVLGNDHMALVELVPTTEQDSREADELAAHFATLGEEDVASIDEDVAALRVRQDAPDSPEDVAKLPQLHLADIGPAKPETPLQKRTGHAIPYLYHDLPTHKIAYVRHYFDVSDVAWEDIPYVSVLCDLLGKLDTAEHTAAQLDIHLRSHLGSFRASSALHTDHNQHDKISFLVQVGASALSEELESLAKIPFEIWSSTHFDDAARIRDILVQRRIGLEEAFITSGHVMAASRAMAGYFKSGVAADQLSGLGFYRFLCDLIEHFDECFDDLRARLERLSAEVFAPARCIASFTGSEADFEAFAGMNPLGVGGEPRTEQAFSFGSLDCIPEPAPAVEAFRIPSNVCFVAKGADLGSITYEGAWPLLSSILGYDYLWNEVRVKGGAYGVSFRSAPTGWAWFASYRDPKLDETLALYDRAAAWLADFQPDPAEMEGYIVSAVASRDAPKKPRAIAYRQDEAFFSDRPEGWRDHVRESLLACTVDEVHEAAETLRQVADSRAVCVFGNAEIIQGAKTKFDSVAALLGEQDPEEA